MNSLAMKREPATDPTLSGLEAGFRIEPIPGRYNSYRLALSGFLSPGWSGRLAAALAQHRVGIERGEAEKVNASSWSSCFELKASPFAGNPEGLDFLLLAATEIPCGREVARIELLDLRVEVGNRHGGSLYVEVKGVDRLGFLGDLLDYFSMRCLFPVKMAIDTRDDIAVDRFWLRGVGGSIPSDSICASVRENLEQLLIRST